MSIDAIQRQSIVSLIWQIALTFIGFLSTIYFARTVGASVLGGYFLFLAYLNIINLVTDGGFGGAAIKRISEGEEQNEFFSAFVVLRSLFVILVVVVLIVFRSYFVDINDAGLFIWLLLALIISLLYGAISRGMHGCGKIGIQSTGEFISNISRIIVQVIAVFLGFGVAGLAGGFVVGMFVGSVVQLRFFDLRFVHFGWRHLKSLSTFSLWIFLISGGMIIFSTADTIMVGYYLSNADVGVYRIVLQFTSLAAFTNIALRSTLYPRVSHWTKMKDSGLIEESLSRAFTYSLVLAIPIFMGGFLLGDKLLYYFYGAEFGGGYMTMIVLFIVQIVNIFYYLSSTYLTAMGHLKDLFKITMVSVVANILLNVVLIPLIGIVGAALATLATMGMNALLVLWVLSKILTIRVESGSLMNILKASVVMSLFLGVYRIFLPMDNVWMALVPVVFGGMVYVVLVLKLDRNIYEELKGIMTKMNVVWPEWL
ncbi:flippase [Methanococcoides methylutens]|uniref:flippase n=1 Tax=Methanococcoides methylutens TaxID=2226 RepID=UPI004044E5EA